MGGKGEGGVAYMGCMRVLANLIHVRGSSDIFPDTNYFGVSMRHRCYPWSLACQHCILACRVTCRGKTAMQSQTSLTGAPSHCSSQGLVVLDDSYVDISGCWAASSAADNIYVGPHHNALLAIR